MIERTSRSYDGHDNNFVYGLTAERVTIRAHGCPRPIRFVNYRLNGEIVKPRIVPLDLSKMTLLLDKPSRLDRFLAWIFP